MFTWLRTCCECTSHRHHWVQSRHKSRQKDDCQHHTTQVPTQPLTPQLNEGKNLNTGTGGFCNSCAVIFCRHQKKSHWCLRIRKLFGGSGIAIWWAGHLEKLKNGGGGGERGREGRRAAPQAHRPWCLSSRHSHASWTQMLQSQCLPFPCRSPPSVTDGSWWIKTPVPSTLQWEQLWNVCYTVSPSSQQNQTLVAHNGNLLNNTPFVNFLPSSLSYRYFLDIFISPL